MNEEGKVSLPRRSARRRQLETLLASAEIHGGSVENRKPALDGMIDTVLKYSKVDDLTEYVSKQIKFKKKLCKIKSWTMRNVKTTLFDHSAYCMQEG